MELVKSQSEKDLQLKLALTDTDLLQVLRGGAVDSLGERAKRPISKSDVLARFSTRQGTLTFTGVLHRRLPVHFLIKPGSRSYGNFIEFLIKELRSISDTRLEANDVTMASDATEVVQGLTEHLENQLRKLDYQTRQNLEEINDIVEVFTSDFEQFEQDIEPDLESGPLRSVLQRQADVRRSEFSNDVSGRSILEASNQRPQRLFRLYDRAEQGPQLISGFFSLEIEELPEALEEELHTPSVLGDLVLRTTRALRQSLEVIGAPLLKLENDTAEIEYRFRLPADVLEHTNFYLHWGPRSSGASSDAESFEHGGKGSWIDEEVPADRVVSHEDGTYSIQMRLTPENAGNYGAALYATPVGSRERFWFSDGLDSDAVFKTSGSALTADLESVREGMLDDIELHGKVLRSLSSYGSFIELVASLSKPEGSRTLSRLLFVATKEESALRRQLAQYYQRAVAELEGGESVLSRQRLKKVVSVLQNIGIGEIVFIAPEGPHAIAGGLAQVIVGLTKALSKRSVSCTVITPLYEEAQGNKHRGAEELLEKGVVVMGQRVPLVPMGSVRIGFGPTFRSGTKEVVQFPRVVESQVYLAEHEGVRIFFLRHPKLADRLYNAAVGDDQLRRAIFLSRGALELVRDRRFGVSPQVLISNDWLSGLVPMLLKTDPRYANDVRLKNVETLHVLHNGGREYQGRLYANQFGEDLWPLLGLDDDHFFGLADPSGQEHINLTAAAVFHSTKGVVAVSRPYARQLLTESGGEGLHHLFRQKRSRLFGISNGVDLAALRTLFWQLGERARAELGLEPLLSERLTHSKLLRRIKDYKDATKICVQRKYGLTEDPQAVLISLVGRLAEQKGIQLLSEAASGSQMSVLERVLVEYPRVQFLLGGPPSIGDPVVERFAQVLGELTLRYPGRIQGIFDFIPHEDALEVTLSSDLFLMPSRYEPGGITQLEALACGTLVIARKVGGIAATLEDYSNFRGEGNSFLFGEFSTDALLKVIGKAIETIKDPKRKASLVAAAASAEHDWGHRAPKYLALLQEAAGALSSSTPYHHLEPRLDLLDLLRA